MGSELLKFGDKRNRGLDLMRFIAISLVLILHHTESAKDVPLFIKYIGSHFWCGVDIFFVLSGFLIGDQVFSEVSNKSNVQKLKEFWVKRWFRTFPLYYFVLFIYIFIKPLIFGKNFNDTTLKYIFYVQNFFSPKDFVQSWSLCIEEQFYLIFPLLALFITKIKNKNWFWLLPFLTSIIIKAYYFYNTPVIVEPNYSYLIRFQTFTNLEGLCLGLFMAKTKVNWIGLIEKRYKLFFALGFLIFFTSLIVTGPYPFGIMAVLCFALLAIGASLMIASSMYIKISDRVYFLIKLVAVTSYGMYLWNNLIMRFFEAKLSQIPWYLNGPLFYCATILISLMTFKMIEEPVMNMRKKFLK